MRTVNIHEAKTSVSSCRQGAKGESFIIAKSGKPMVKVVAIDAPAAGEMRRVGFMAGRFSVPDDFDRMADDEIEKLFGGHETSSRYPSSALGGGRARKAPARSPR
ncbi:type II toxin-antitoxin system prevent-host-death family antitoxin [Mesorhizobium sp. M0854]|uniref:type II toxin-antitoxin system Phd/YefM family antitoxin n=1 Tax=Mesorhizobium sp. M0854 TaxID=2957013 RepID=UPI00333B4ACE